MPETPRCGATTMYSSYEIQTTTLEHQSCSASSSFFSSTGSETSLAPLVVQPWGSSFIVIIIIDTMRRRQMRRSRILGVLLKSELTRFLGERARQSEGSRHRVDELDVPLTSKKPVSELSRLVTVPTFNKQGINANPLKEHTSDGTCATRTFRKTRQAQKAGYTEVICEGRTQPGEAAQSPSVWRLSRILFTYRRPPPPPLVSYCLQGTWWIRQTSRTALSPSCYEAPRCKQ
ncbi:hypothetical protein FN846DRAFT_283608 [Sphaerosporella brunnea]|uniref:Uncharacterized protein n=1 Tax=Sphaerosporella brunnea TaxID=1250544 RepID=A0A5J5EM27_9PEZI|nr:hypothetical protein FN846DRAFT_283608 [Sphaerosporella brunnea]